MTDQARMPAAQQARIVRLSGIAMGIVSLASGIAVLIWGQSYLGLVDWLSAVFGWVLILFGIVDFVIFGRVADKIERDAAKNQTN